MGMLGVRHPLTSEAVDNFNCRVSISISRIACGIKEASIFMPILPTMRQI